jgi:hypothetical protein
MTATRSAGVIASSTGLVYEEVPDATPGLCDVLVKV